MSIFKLSHYEIGVVEDGNATQWGKNHPAHTNADNAPSSFSLQEFTNLPGIGKLSIKKKIFILVMENRVLWLVKIYSLL